jgi:D-alanine-D-alanine ligase
VTSAIERPERTDVLLDFKTKYLSSGGVGGTKILGTHNPGMLAMTRTLNPSLSSDIEGRIRSWAERCFARANAAGVPRVDFLSNAVTGELWLNEVNSCPGSFGFFLWESAKEPLLFTELISFLVDEAIAIHKSGQIPSDPTTEHSRLFPRS